MTPDELMARFDGFVLTGGRPNVHPEEYGEEETEAHGAFDCARDQLTLPLIRAMQVGDAGQQNLIRDAIENGTAENFDDIRQMIESTGALQYTIDQAHAQAAAAKQSIAELDDGEYRQALMFLADYAVERRF